MGIEEISDNHHYWHEERRKKYNAKQKNVESGRS